MATFLFFLVVFQVVAAIIAWGFDVNFFGSLILIGAAFWAASSANKQWRIEAGEQDIIND